MVAQFTATLYEADMMVDGKKYLVVSLKNSKFNALNRLPVIA